MITFGCGCGNVKVSFDYLNALGEFDQKIATFIPVLVDLPLGWKLIDDVIKCKDCLKGE